MVRLRATHGGAPCFHSFTSLSVALSTSCLQRPHRCEAGRAMTTYGKHWASWQERKRQLMDDIKRRAEELPLEEVQQQLLKLRAAQQLRKLSQKQRARDRAKERRLEALARRDPDRLRSACYASA